MIPRFLLLYILSFGLAWASDARPEIEALLGYVENLNGATFIRNGDEHRAKEAAAHLRTKWGRLEKKVVTTEDFIQLCASKSSLSGERYKVRFSDGSERFCDELLRDKLKELRTETERRKGSAGAVEKSDLRSASTGEICRHVIRRRIRAGLFHQDAFAQRRPFSGAIIYTEISQPHDDMQSASGVIIVLGGRLGLDTERPAIFAKENETRVSLVQGRGRLLSTHDYWLWIAPAGRPAGPLCYEGAGALSKQHPEKLQGFLTAVCVNCCPGHC